MKEELIKTAKALMEIPWCYGPLKDACGAWIDAVGTEGEKAAAEALFVRLREDVMGVDETIEFFKTPAAEAHFGKEVAAQKLEGLIAHKAAGGKYCNCDACALGAKLLEAESEILG